MFDRLFQISKLAYVLAARAHIIEFLVDETPVEEKVSGA